MSKKKVAVPIGIDFDTNLPVSINELDRSKIGKKCNLYCPNEQCKAKLKAVFSKTGEKVDYLSHINIVATLACAESALHLQGKMALLTLSQFTTSTYELIKESYATDFLGISHFILGKALFNHRPIVFISPPLLEQTIKDDVEIKGDVVVSCQYDNQRLDVNFEIKVTHAVDTEKLAKIKQLDITTIEIDISHLISLGVVTDAEVLEAVKQPSNHQILHVNSKLEARYKRASRDSAKQLIVRANKEITKRIVAIEQEWVANKLELPQYPYKLTALPHNVRVEALKISEKKPTLPIQVTVHSLKHEIDNCFNLSLSINNELKTVPLYIRHKEHNLDEIRLSKISFLYVDIRSLLGHSLPACVYWGFNVKAHQYQLAHNNQADIAKEDYRQHKINKSNVNKNKVLGILSDIRRRKFKLADGDYFHSRNEEKIQNKAIDLMSRIHDMNVPQEIIKGLYSPDIDKNNVFGVITNVWQTYIFYYAVNGGSLQNISATIKYLENNGISIVEPYKTALLHNKLFEEVGMLLPFKNPYLIISEYRWVKRHWLKRLTSQVTKTGRG